jgi:hypothetical protein
VYYNKEYHIENDNLSIQSNIEKWINRGYNEIVYNPKLLEITNLPKTNSYIALFELSDNDFGYAELIKGINGKYKIKKSQFETGLSLIDYEEVDTGKIKYVILYCKNQYKMIDHILIKSHYEDYSFTADVANDEMFLRFDEVPSNIQYPYAVDLTYYDKDNNVIQ